MDFVTLVVLTVLVISGVWGSMIIAGLLKRSTAKLESGPKDPRIDELQEDHHLLEARIERLEEELNFLRELHNPDTSTGLPPGDQNDSDGGR